MCSPIAQRLISFFLAAMCSLSALAASTMAMAQEEKVELSVVAGQIRSQGYTCTKPKSAERDETESVPGKPVYHLVCDDGAYLVRLVPKQAAEVMKTE